MKTKASVLSPLAQEMANVQSGKISPGRVWFVKRRPDGTVERRQVSRVMFKRKRAIEAAAQNTALPARQVMGVSQDRFAELLGISPSTVRNLEQGRTKPTGPTSKLLSIAEQYPQIFISMPTTKVQIMRKNVAVSTNDVGSLVNEVLAAVPKRRRTVASAKSSKSMAAR